VRLLRYALAAVGPVGSAAAQFLLSLILLRVLSPHDFGSFSFLLVATVLSWGVWSALLCAPLPVLLARADEGDREALGDTIFAADLAGAAVAGLVFFGLARLLGVATGASVLFALYGAAALVRWFARAHAYAHGRQLRTTASDLVYGVALVAGVGGLAAAGQATLGTAYAALLASAALGLLPFGGDFLRRQFVRVRPAALGRYPAIWREHAGWSLLGVLTTEATANAHAYLVTALAGPAAFAPIAASALMIRPIGVAQNALSDFERAEMARDIGRGEVGAALAAVRTFRWVLVAAWGATALLAAALLFGAPRLIFPAHYPLPFLVTGAALWMVVAGVRLVRAPESVLLQAAGSFRALAMASVGSAALSIAAVAALLRLAGPLWSIGGVMLGEALFAAVTWLAAHRWRRARRAEAEAGTCCGAAIV
jgi:O-antigen/teichoic acid export membrane protein